MLLGEIVSGAPLSFACSFPVAKGDLETGRWMGDNGTEIGVPIMVLLGLLEWSEFVEDCSSSSNTCCVGMGGGPTGPVSGAGGGNVPSGMYEDIASSSEQLH